jgi:hypothetical protein
VHVKLSTFQILSVSWNRVSAVFLQAFGLRSITVSAAKSAKCQIRSAPSNHRQSALPFSESSRGSFKRLGMRAETSSTTQTRRECFLSPKDVSVTVSPDSSSCTLLPRISGSSCQKSQVPVSPERLNASALDFGRGADSVAVVLRPSVNVDHRTRKGILLFLLAFPGHTHFLDFHKCCCCAQPARGPTGPSTRTYGQTSKPAAAAIGLPAAPTPLLKTCPSRVPVARRGPGRREPNVAPYYPPHFPRIPLRGGLEPSRRGLLLGTPMGAWYIESYINQQSMMTVNPGNYCHN